MKTIRILMTAIAVAALLAVSGCITVEVSPEVEKFPRPIKVSLAETSLLPGVTFPKEGLVEFDRLMKKAMRENGGECYVYTDQKKEVDVLVKMTGTNARFGQLELDYKGETPRGGKEIFRLSGGGLVSGAWIVPTWPRFMGPMALCIKEMLCGEGGNGRCVAPKQGSR